MQQNTTQQNPCKAQNGVYANVENAKNFNVSLRYFGRSKIIGYFDMVFGLGFDIGGAHLV
jgi:hypothetical protein